MSSIVARLRTHLGMPGVLCARGVIPSEPCRAVAIVGSRNASDADILRTRGIATDLASKGVIIISGLAMGIDSAAHTGALEAGGITIACMATGLDIIYPACNRPLAQRILDNGGALVTEYMQGTSACRETLMQRNRIVVGLADAVIVAAVNIPSGTYDAAQKALAMGIPTYVLPRNRAADQLKKQGAHDYSHFSI